MVRQCADRECETGRHTATPQGVLPTLSRSRCALWCGSSGCRAALAELLRGGVRRRAAAVTMVVLTVAGVGAAVPVASADVTYAVTATILVGSEPRGVAVTPDGSTAYVTNLGS